MLIIKNIMAANNQAGIGERVLLSVPAYLLFIFTLKYYLLM